MEIKKLLDSKKIGDIDKELSEESPFVYTALEFTDNVDAVKALLNSNNQTLILKSAEVLKKLGDWSEEKRIKALKNVKDSNIKSIIEIL